MGQFSVNLEYKNHLVLLAITENLAVNFKKKLDQKKRTLLHIFAHIQYMKPHSYDS